MQNTYFYLKCTLHVETPEMIKGLYKTHCIYMNNKSAHHVIHTIIKSIGPQNIIILVCAIFTGKYHTLRCG